MASFVNTCDVCQRTKEDQPRQCPLSPLEFPDRSGQSIGTDFVSTIAVSTHGTDAIPTFVVHILKQALFVPTKSSINAADSVDLYMQHVFRLHGLSTSIISDRHSRFTFDFLIFA